MKKYDILTALDICVDLVIELGKAEPEFGQKEHLVDDYLLELGGSSVIFACQAAKLGLRAAGLAKVGEDVFGQLILERLHEAGVFTNLIERDPSLKTGLGLALCRSDDRAILTYLGSINGVGPNSFNRNILAATRHLHIGSYYLMDAIRPHYREIIEMARLEHVTVSLDTNWDPDEEWTKGVQEILPLIDILFLNENEAMGLGGTSDPVSAVTFLGQVVPTVVLKKGGQGALAYCNGITYTSEALDVIVKDTVGAGDNFDAGFVYGMLTGQEIQACLDIAVFCGSLSTTCLGGISGQPRKAQLHGLLTI